MSRVPAEIRTWHLRNTSLECHHYVSMLVDIHHLSTLAANITWASCPLLPYVIGMTDEQEAGVTVPLFVFIRLVRNICIPVARSV